MMYVMALILAFSASAGECYLYRLKGPVEENQGLYLKVNKDTNSQRDFLFSRDIEFEMAPYIKAFVDGKFIIDGKTIVKIEEVKHAVPDPLQHKEEMVRLSTVPCPTKKKGAK